MPKPYPKEFREDVVRVARSREPGVRIKDVAADLGITEPCLTNWRARADREDGTKPGPTSTELAELREFKKRNRLLVNRRSDGWRGRAANESDLGIASSATSSPCRAVRDLNRGGTR